MAVTERKLDFGPWEQIFYGELDGRRKKRVLVKIIGEYANKNIPSLFLPAVLQPSEVYEPCLCNILERNPQSGIPIITNFMIYLHTA